MSSPQNKVQAIQFYHPYSAIFPLDPRNIYSVGDQVISEHLFPFHSKQSLKGGFKPVFSDVKFDSSEQSVTIEMKYPIQLSEKKFISIEEIAKALEARFMGTRHLPKGSSLLSVTVLGNKIRLNFSKIPVNLSYLFTMPDLAIFDSSYLPITQDKLQLNFGGPYLLSKISDGKVFLSKNKYYPSDLVANNVEEVVYNSYSPSKIKEFTDSVSIDSHHLIYLFGHTLTSELAERFKSKEYQLQYFPNEWFTYSIFDPQFSPKEKAALSVLIDNEREHLNKILNQNQSVAYSIAPSDRYFGLTKEVYHKSRSQQETEMSLEDAVSVLSAKKLTIGTLHRWSEIPVFKLFFEKLKQYLPQLRFVSTDSIAFSHDEKQSEKIDIFVGMIGMSPADPLGHLSFLASCYPIFSQFLTPEKLASLAMIDDQEKFNEAIREVELKILKERILVPIAHFPGIVAEAPGFERDENLAWSWGTQAWTYRIR